MEAGRAGGITARSYHLAGKQGLWVAKADHGFRHSVA